MSTEPEPTPDEAVRIDPDEHQLKVGYTFEDNVLEVRCTNGGARITLRMDYDVDNVREEADLLVQAVPGMVEAVLDNIITQQEAANG